MILMLFACITFSMLLLSVVVLHPLLFLICFIIIGLLYEFIRDTTPMC